MPPKKKDKGKGILKDPVSQTPLKAPQPSSPPKEKLLSSAMPIKSWIDMIEDEEAKSKAISSHEQVNQWMKSISKSLELMLALQSFSQSQISPKEEKSISKEISKVSSQNVANSQWILLALGTGSSVKASTSKEAMDILSCSSTPILLD